MKKKKQKLILNDVVRLNSYRIIDEVVERAVLVGIRRSKKHVDNPSEEYLAQEIHKYVMNELCEILNFSDEL